MPGGRPLMPEGRLPSVGSASALMETRGPTGPLTLAGNSVWGADPIIADDIENPGVVL